MQISSLSGAEQTYFERIVEDCEQVLGPGIEIRDLEFDSNGDVVLRLRYRFGSADVTSEGRGETVVAAHGALRDTLVLDRLRLGFRELIDPRRS